MGTREYYQVLGKTEKNNKSKRKRREITHTVSRKIVTEIERRDKKGREW